MFLRKTNNKDLIIKKWNEKKKGETNHISKLLTMFLKKTNTSKFDITNPQIITYLVKIWCSNLNNQGPNKIIRTIPKTTCTWEAPLGWN